MKPVPMICPSCNASIEVDGTRDFVYCQYCGTKIFLDKEIDRHEVVHIFRDEAKLKEIEIQEREKQKAEKEAKEAAERAHYEQVAKAFKIRAQLNRFKTVAIIGILVAIISGLFFVEQSPTILGVVAFILAILTPDGIDEKGSIKYQILIFLLSFVVYMVIVAFSYKILNG